MLLEELQPILIGTGGAANVYSTEVEPGTVRKVVISRNGTPFGTETTLKRDGYFRFVKMLQKKNRKDNPYFPQIYDVQINKLGDKKFSYTVEMERLYPFSDISDREAEVIGNRIFGDFDRLRSSYYRKDVHKGDAKVFLQHILENLISFPDKYADMMANIIDKDFFQAVMLLRHMVRVGLAQSDIIEDNLAVRRSPYGAQLVLLDPVG